MSSNAVTMTSNAMQNTAHHPSMFFGFLLILLSTIFRGGNRYLPLLALECISAALLLFIIFQSLKTKHRNAFVFDFQQLVLLFLIFAPFWILVVYLTPLPSGIWNTLPGRMWYAEVIGHKATDVEWRVASLTPTATWAAAISGLPLMACFYMAFATNRMQLSLLCRVWICVALVQALLGLLQLGPFPMLRFGLESSEIVGTFASKNTFSNFLVMAIPLLVWEIGGRGRQDKDKRQQSWLWGIFLFVLIVTLFAATSRTGITTGLFVAMLAVALLPARGAHRWAGLPWAFWGLAALIALALAAGGLVWLDRFDADRLITDDATRALMRDGTWQGILAFWPLGSGLGSYAAVFPRFQAPELGRHLIDLAHSDYLQLLMELGALGLALMAALLALLLRRAAQLARAGRRGWQAGDTLAVAAGLGALAFGLHAWVDYPMRIPANAMFAAFLIGVVLRQPSDDRAEGTS